MGKIFETEAGMKAPGFYHLWSSRGWLEETAYSGAENSGNGTEVKASIPRIPPPTIFLPLPSSSSLWFTEVQEHLDLWSANWDLVTEYGYANKAKLGPIRGELSKGSLADLTSCFLNMITLRALADTSQVFHLTIPLRSGFEFCVQQSDPQGQKAP